MNTLNKQNASIAIEAEKSIVLTIDGVQSINFELLEEKTNSILVERIKKTIANVSTWDEDDREIRYLVEENSHEVKVVMCFYGNFVKVTYCKIRQSVNQESMYWTDIRHFFDMPYEMKKLD